MSKPQDTNTTASSAAAPVGGSETAALMALNQALGGVEALNAAITLMEQAAGSIATARDDGISQINTHVETTVKTKINQMVATALAEMLQTLKKIQDLLDPFLDLFRQEEQVYFFALKLEQLV